MQRRGPLNGDCCRDDECDEGRLIGCVRCDEGDQQSHRGEHMTHHRSRDPMGGNQGDGNTPGEGRVQLPGPGHGRQRSDHWNGQQRHLPLRQPGHQQESESRTQADEESRIRHQLLHCRDHVQATPSFGSGHRAWLRTASACQDFAQPGENDDTGDPTAGLRCAAVTSSGGSRGRHGIRPSPQGSLKSGTGTVVLMKQRAQSSFEAVEQDLRDLSKWMYEHPELAYQEHDSSARLATFLERHGFLVEYPAYGLDTAFEAKAGSGGPNVVLCAEYDALPRIGHACGHNIIAAASLGAGVALAPLADELGITVTVLGTPAEERFGGKVDLINAGAFAGVTAAMMIHPAPRDVLDPPTLAVSHMDVEFHGKASHAAFAPQEGVNALDAFVQAYVNISTLRQSLLPTDKVHGIIEEGGDAPNVIPSYTRSSWYVRADSKARLQEVEARVHAAFEAAAVATGCDVELIPTGHPYDHLQTNHTIAALFEENCGSLGRSMGHGHELPIGATGSTDMGNVSHLVPSIHPFLSIDSLPAVNHQPEFADHTITPAGERAIHDGALSMAWTVIDLSDRELWDEL